MQAIRVVYLGPTNFLGSRYKATAQAGSITISLNYALNENENARRACNALRKKLGWTNATSKNYGDEWIEGSLSDGSYVFVNPHI
jgi:hypothetical protein